MARFQPGQSGNPGGRPKSSLAAALAAEGEKKKRGKTNAAALAALAWKNALAGDLAWAEFLADRLLPKTIGLEDADGAPVKFSLVLGNEQ